jgi:hypothetical protein
MQDFFVDRKKTCGISGKSNEVIVFKRRGKSNSRFTDNSIYDGLLQDDTQIANGDIVTESDDKYLTIARRNGYMSKIAQFEKTNCVASIYTISANYVGTVKTGDKETLVVSSVPVVQTSVTANMHMYDAGLLPDTIKKLLIPHVTIGLDYRVKIDGKNYWVTSVDSNEYEGLYLVQVKSDNRVTK